ncbi:MAG: hypothetical protein LH628_22680 [Microcoleus sp. CAN_BIN18]|nr:hypothetical protein [Microcoleus sp. CAN_BIN18]
MDIHLPLGSTIALARVLNLSIALAISSPDRRPCRSPENPASFRSAHGGRNRVFEKNLS